MPSEHSGCGVLELLLDEDELLKLELLLEEEEELEATRRFLKITPEQLPPCTTNTRPSLGVTRNCSQPWGRISVTVRMPTGTFPIRTVPLGPFTA